VRREPLQRAPLPRPSLYGSPDTEGQTEVHDEGGIDVADAVEAEQEMLGGV
jgi:hypothetical protein